MKLNPDKLTEYKQRAYDRLYDQLHQQTVELEFEIASMQLLGKSEKEIASALATKMQELEATKVRLKILKLMLDEAKPLVKKEGGRTDERGVLLYHPTARAKAEGNHHANVRQG
jgi:hypothetical protein